MKLLAEEKAQAATEVIGLVLVAVTIVVIVGFALKNFITQEIAPEFEQNLG